MLGLFLLPWGLLLLGLFPLYRAVGLGCPDCAQAGVYPGLPILLQAVLLAGVGSLFSRLPLGPRTRFLLVLGLGLFALDRGYESALLLSGSPLPPLAPLGGVLGAGAFALAFFQATGLEVPLLPPLPAYTLPSGLMQKEALWALEGSLEGLARRRPLFLLYLVTEAEPEALVRLLRNQDLAFDLGRGEYLILLQGVQPEEAIGLLKRIQAYLPLRAHAVERWQKERLLKVLQRLRAEAMIQAP
ncbi:MAG: hypothetical protein C4300_05810 [Thermus sp.]|uniref:hypothetical protein n=1 Tax=Thermus sp. TaxID=275 RepID=UPI003331EB55